MGKFDGILICTDLDGTLLRNDKSISKENEKAIEYFKKEGGYFTFVTGRMPYYVGDIVKKVKPNAPFGCANGGGLYDHINKKYLWTNILHDSFTNIIKCIDDNFPKAGIQISAFDKTYFSKDNLSMQRFREATGVEYVVRHYTDFTEPVAKILFGSEEEEEILNIEKMLFGHPDATKFDFIRSEQSLYEVIPKGTHKGTAIEKLCEYLKIDIKKSIALGDYYNDVSMIKTAGVGIAVSNACPDALNAADIITVSNEEHAIAKVIDELEKGGILI